MTMLADHMNRVQPLGTVWDEFLQICRLAASTDQPIDRSLVNRIRIFDEAWECEDDAGVVRLAELICRDTPIWMHRRAFELYRQDVQ